MRGIGDHPQARLTTFWSNGSLIDGYIVADHVPAVVMPAIGQDRRDACGAR